MKALAKQAIEDVVKQYDLCQQCRITPSSAPLHPWQWPTRPWTRLHIDFAGPMDSKIFSINLFIYCFTAQVHRTPGPTACSRIKMLDKVCLKSY